MPKMKTRKSLSKRVKITGTGKLMHQMKGINHIKSSKSPSRLRKAKKRYQMNDTMAKKVRQLINM